MSVLLRPTPTLSHSFQLLWHSGREPAGMDDLWPLPPLGKAGITATQHLLSLPPYTLCKATSMLRRQTPAHSVISWLMTPTDQIPLSTMEERP